ncbi:MAG: DsbA family protein [Caulobacteraceae bacterium]|nr:DsbA family protein [Caulobacteraceae bacterium]
MKVVPILYFSDLLCVWAYIAQWRVNAIKAAFGEQVRFETRFCSVFGASERKIATNWGAKGGYEGFNAHLRHAAEQFPEISLNPDIWLTVRPASSNAAHLFLKAQQRLEASGECAAGTTDNLTWAVRRAFFESARDIGRWEVLRAVAREQGVDPGPIEALIHDGRAFADLCCDLQDAEAMRIQGSPSFVLNEGRQKLYGNVGFRVLEANIQELLRAPTADQASWC